jgi:hypothetical protein
VLTSGADFAPQFSPDVPSITISAPTIQVTESATQNVTGYFDVLTADTKTTDKLDGFQVDLTTPDPTKIQLTTADILTATTPANFYGASASYVLTGFSPSPGAPIINNSAAGRSPPSDRSAKRTPTFSPAAARKTRILCSDPAQTPTSCTSRRTRRSAPGRTTSRSRCPIPKVRTRRALRSP